MITQPSEQPLTGGSLSSSEVQQWHPWMKKSYLLHISSGTWGSRQKEHGLWVVSCMQFLQQPSLQVVAGSGPMSPGVHSSSGLRQPLSLPEQPWVSMNASPLPPTNLPVFWQKVQVLGSRSGRVLQQSSSQLDLELTVAARRRRASKGLIMINIIKREQVKLEHSNQGHMPHSLQILAIQGAALVAVPEPLLQAGGVEAVVAAGHCDRCRLVALLFGLVHDLKGSREAETLQADGARINLGPPPFLVLVEVGDAVGEGDGRGAQFFEFAVAEELHEEDHEFDDEDGEDEGGSGKVRLGLREIPGVEGEVEPLEPVEDHLAEVLVVGDEVALLQGEQVPDLQQFGDGQDDEQVLEGSDQDAEDEDVVRHLPDVQLLPREEGHLLHQLAHLEADEHEDGRHQHQQHPDLQQLRLVLPQVLCELLEFVAEAEGEGGVVDPEDGDHLEAPPLLDGPELPQHHPLVLVEVEPLVVHEDEHQPQDDQLLVVASIGTVQRELVAHNSRKGQVYSFSPGRECDQRLLLTQLTRELLLPGVQRLAARVLESHRDTLAAFHSMQLFTLGRLLHAGQLHIHDDLFELSQSGVLHLDDQVEGRLRLAQGVQALPPLLAEEVGEQVGLVLGPPDGPVAVPADDEAVVEEVGDGERLSLQEEGEKEKERQHCLPGYNKAANIQLQYKSSLDNH